MRDSVHALSDESKAEVLSLRVRSFPITICFGWSSKRILWWPY